MSGRALAVSLAIAALAAPAPAEAAPRTGPVQLGAAVNSYGFAADPDPRYRATLANYEAVTAESAMKILDLQPQRDRFVFDTADAIVAFAAAHGQHVHGHTLAWCEDAWLPSWLTSRGWTRTELLAVLKKHIDTVMAHFRGRVESWDVANEPFNADGSVRDCLWSREIGDDWVEQALTIARAADPTATLFVNEVHADTPNDKFAALEAMAQNMLARDVPLDGIGLQMHTVRGAPAQERLEEAIRRIGDIGLAVHISEMDVPTWYLGPTQEEKLARQADSYRRVAAACQAQPACFRITTWGFSDRYTWRGTSSQPLPFDVEYGAKPAWAALRELVPAPPPPPPAPVAVAVPPPSPLATLARPRLSARIASRRRAAVLRRGLRLVVRVKSQQPLHVVLVMRLRGRVIANAELDLPGATSRTVRLRLSGKARRLLRRASRARLVLEAEGVDAAGRQVDDRAAVLLRR
jgi:GH35 family endo-1,4-beta-xylanase